MSRATIGFIGGGQMARALARGVVRAGLAQATDILMADPSDIDDEMRYLVAALRRQ